MLTMQEHADEARLSAGRMMQDVADGLSLQASSQAWHAAKHAVNAAVASRNRRPVQYAEKRRVSDELAAEPGNSNLKQWFSYPWRLHGNADQGFMDDNDVAEAVRITGLLVNRLLTIAGCP